MFRNLSISSKITALVVIVVLVTVAVISLLSYNYSRDAVENRYGNALHAIAKSKGEKVETYFDKVIQTLNLLQSSPELVKGATAKTEEASSGGGGMFDFFGGGGAEEESDDPFAAMDEEPDTDDPFAMMEMEEEEPVAPVQTYNVEEYLQRIKENFSYSNVYITNPSGRITFSTDPAKSAGSNFIDTDGVTLKNSLTGTYISNLEFKDDKYYIYAGAPVNHETGETSIVLVQLELSRIYNMLGDTTGLGQTGEIILVRMDPDKDRVNYLNRPRNKPEGALVVLEKVETLPHYIKKSFTEESGVGSGTDYRGEEVLASWQNVPNTGWGLIAKMDTDEIFENSNQLLWRFIFSGLIIIALSVLLSLIYSQQLVKPIESLKTSLHLLSQGILPSRIERQSSDEFGEMAETTNNLVRTLKGNAQFAQRIGEGDFDAEYKPVSNEDLLGNSLVNMRNNLVAADKAEKQRNWIVTGVAEVSEILRSYNDLELLGDEIIKYIVHKIGAVQGAFYVVNDDDPDNPFLEMNASYAYNRKKHLFAKFKFAEGLVGQAAAEKDTILRIEIPEDYVTVTSGILGDQKPNCIMIVPLITEEKVYGALEFAGFNRFDEGKVKFVEELSLSLARTIFNIKVNARTRRLLEESQTMSAELQEKQEVLRQNAEEMQATQEELTRSNQALEEQIEEVNRTQKRMQLLLENASEVITIYEEDETIRYISPSVEPILGYSQKEMIDSSDIVNVHEDYTDLFHQMFQDLKNNPLEQVTIQYEYKTKEGNYIWIESTGTNFLSNPAIQGFIVNSRDITERRRAELEQRMRSKMQALSENSPDLITRIENEMVSYINPVIEEYTGKKPDKYLNQPVSDVELNEQVLNKWLEIVNTVRQNDNKVRTEMDFPSALGDRVMQVNAIPEYDEHENIESVLVVSHDITERKLIELEIQNKNKKIADSINYSKRLQNAILPNTAVINKALPDSFILYKPKDVVSGDFPWYLRMGDIIYIAAVDCTGHGVPGALLSLIGYFLLNDIVKSRKVEDPGIILDQLDEGVTQTLRQDQDDSKTKDGMDIALCRIDVAKKEVQYAGAHRPLYAMINGEMEEIKGNKFPIGGGIYKNQTNFTNHTIKLNSEDSIYFCSDGFPDQFGGPQNRKFGPKRLRSLITDIHKKDMKEAYKIFDKEWEGWKSDEKQTDDVLLIGIKF
ncbi:MAG: PAS domain S-box protein [Candidatus Cyclobacteriaceae bacterium M2_1C_046]